MVGIERRHRLGGPACRECVGHRARGSNNDGETDHADGLLHFGSPGRAGARKGAGDVKNTQAARYVSPIVVFYRRSVAKSSRLTLDNVLGTGALFSGIFAIRWYGGEQSCVVLSHRVLSHREN